MTDAQQTLVFVIHAVKQFCFGFEELNRVSDEMQDGSAAKAFYLCSLYHYIAVFYLLDKNGGDARGGALYKALRQHGFEGHLSAVYAALDRPIGGTTFGEMVRVFRNKAIVHTTYADADLDHVYALANMEDPAISEAFHNALWEVYTQTKLLLITLSQLKGLAPSDFGITLPE